MTRPCATDGAALTDREVLVLGGIAAGKSNATIGAENYLSQDTVKTHARRLYEKLGARDRAHAVALGFARGLLVADPLTFEVRVVSNRPKPRQKSGQASLAPGGQLGGELMAPAVETAVGLAAQQVPVGAP